MKVIWESIEARQFKLWRYHPGHSQIMYFSPDWNNRGSKSRIFVYFKPVDEISLPTSFKITKIEEFLEFPKHTNTKLGKQHEDQKIYVFYCCDDIIGYIIAYIYIVFSDGGKFQDAIDNEIIYSMMWPGRYDRAIKKEAKPRLPVPKWVVKIRKQSSN